MCVCISAILHLYLYVQVYGHSQVSGKQELVYSGHNIYYTQYSLGLTNVVHTLLDWPHWLIVVHTVCQKSSMAIAPIYTTRVSGSMLPQEKKEILGVTGGWYVSNLILTCNLKHIRFHMYIHNIMSSGPHTYACTLLSMSLAVLAWLLIL